MSTELKKLKSKNSSLDISSWLQEDRFFTDCVVISSDNHKFNLHRVVIANKSKVFRAMLTTDMKEGKTGEIKLSENTKVLKNLFDLIYKGECEGSLMDFMDLCDATKKYLLYELNGECLLKLKDFLNINNAVEILIFAYDNDSTLQGYALELISQNFEAIRASDEWNLLIDNREILNLAIDTYIRHMNNKFKEMNATNIISDGPILNRIIFLN